MCVVLLPMQVFLFSTLFLMLWKMFLVFEFHFLSHSWQIFLSADVAVATDCLCNVKLGLPLIAQLIELWSKFSSTFLSLLPWIVARRNVARRSCCPQSSGAFLLHLPFFILFFFFFFLFFFIFAASFMKHAGESYDHSTHENCITNITLPLGSTCNYLSGHEAGLFLWLSIKDLRLLSTRVVAALEGVVTPWWSLSARFTGFLWAAE